MMLISPNTQAQSGVWRKDDLDWRIQLTSDRLQVPLAPGLVGGADTGNKSLITLEPPQKVLAAPTKFYLPVRTSCFRARRLIANSPMYFFFVSHIEVGHGSVRQISSGQGTQCVR